MAALFCWRALTAMEGENAGFAAANTGLAAISPPARAAGDAAKSAPGNFGFGLQLHFDENRGATARETGRNDGAHIDCNKRAT